MSRRTIEPAKNIMEFIKFKNNNKEEYLKNRLIDMFCDHSINFSLKNKSICLVSSKTTKDYPISDYYTVAVPLFESNGYNVQLIKNQCSDLNNIDNEDCIYLGLN